MENKELELRMYFFVPYNISPIQQAIQAGHAALEYAFYYRNEKIFENFLKNHKTWIILNGGTTNNTFVFSDSFDDEGKPIGTLNQIERELLLNRIQYTRFCEPDLNNALTALCFICDERVFNKKDYPDFNEELWEDTISLRDVMYKEWLTSIGGEQNLFLRNLLKDKKLA